MRKLAFLVAPVALPVVALLACEDNPAGAPSFSFDAGLSDWSAPAIDATSPEVTPDAAPDAPAIPHVSVTVADANGPRAHVTIVFHDVAGAVIETKLTGADGRAVHTGTVPAMVSALLARGGQRHIVTWTAVEDGDDLQLRDANSDEDEQVGLYSVSFMSEAPNANLYSVRGPGGANESYGTAAELPMYRSCMRAQNAVLIAARTYAGSTTAHAFKKGNPGVTDGGTVAITTGNWAAPTPFTLSVANAPDQEYGEQLLEIADGTGFTNYWGGREGSTTTYPTATGFADALQASASFSSNGSARSIVKRFAPAASVSLDYATLLPELTSVSVDPANPRRPVVRWTAKAATAATDGGRVTFAFSGPADANYAWTFVVPPGSTTVTGPEMPKEAEDFLPHAADAGVQSSFYSPSVLFVEADVLAGYAQFRRQQGVLLGRSLGGFGDDTLPALPTNGTYRTTSYMESTPVLR